MATIEAVYEGDLRCRVTHGRSGAEFITDAPPDNQGQGRSFSPTDLVAAALGSCLLTVMGIVAKRHGIDLAGARVQVEKDMVNDPERRIGRLAATIVFPKRLSQEQQTLLERTAASCPVHHSLHRSLNVPVQFVYP